nr:hypothetical protein [Paenibacillus pseudetheri]
MVIATPFHYKFEDAERILTRCNPRGEQSDHGNRNSKRVVAECPEQVLPDIVHRFVAHVDHIRNICGAPTSGRSSLHLITLLLKAVRPLFHQFIDRRHEFR